MSTAARKARKRAGEKFVRIPKVGTPFELRSIACSPDPLNTTGQSNRKKARWARLRKAVED